MHRDFRSLSAACQRIVSNFGAEVDLELRLAILRRENSRNSALRGAENMSASADKLLVIRSRLLQSQPAASVFSGHSLALSVILGGCLAR